MLAGRPARAPRRSNRSALSKTPAAAAGPTAALSRWIKRQRRPSNWHHAHLRAIGDIVGQPMLAHKAVHEAHVAAEVIAGELQGNKNWQLAFNARAIPSVTYTDPEVGHGSD